MENLETNVQKRALTRAPKDENSDSAYGEKAESISAIIADDPAAFLILCLVQIGQIHSVSELKTYFRGNSELVDFIDTMLSRMEEMGLIQVSGDQIECPKRMINLEGSPAEYKRFLPQVFRIMMNRALTNAEENAARKKSSRDMYRWFCFQESPEIAAEIQAISQEYRAKMVALQEKVLNQGSEQLNGVRFVGVVNCVMDPEDFG